VPLLETLPGISLAYRIGRDLLSFALKRSRGRKLTEVQKLELRQKWKPQFDGWLRTQHRDELRTDVIIRDVRRMDDYPEAKEGRGISPWFNVGLLDTYHRGILIGLRWVSLVEDEKTGGWRYPNYDAGEKGTLTCALVGSIPFEFIEGVDWEGDEYYGFPHIYCHFDGPKRQPYEKIDFREKRGIPDIIYWKEVADYEPVRKLTRKRGIKTFY
jgi:hypothetical protein